MNKRLKISLIFIAIILIAALSISLAYSRYYTKLTGRGEATVAKWSFDAKANGQAMTAGTITLGNTTSANSKVADGKIAPGTSGEFTVELDATDTEVELDYTIKFENVTGTFPTNLKFYQTKTGDTYSDEITDITTQGLNGTIGLNDATKTKSVSIYWVWEYQTGTDDATKATNDATDTTDGEAAANITFDVVVTGTQKAA